LLKEMFNLSLERNISKEWLFNKSILIKLLEHESLEAKVKGDVDMV